MNQSGAGATGRRLGRYHLAEPLGGGPTGEVFRAKVYGVAGFERQFAIKRFHAELVAEPDRAAQLAQAARLYGALEHPRIARMHEFGVAAGETFTATELVRGVDLAQLVDATFGTGRPLPAGAAIALLSAAARAVGFAHGRGLAHLGLSPTNVLCTAEGDVKVTDFGFLPLRLPARPADDPSLLARLPYLAPEQHRGETGTPATDVFQLGLLAHELLRGEPALTGGDASDIETRALTGEPVPLNVPKALGHVVRRALARSPYERFPDAGAMADALDAAVRATPLAGDRRDLAGLVRTALDQQAQLHESQLSGALRLPVPAPPRRSAAHAVVAPPAETPAPTATRTPVPVQRSSTPVPVQRTPTPVPVQRTPTPPPPERRLTPVPAQRSSTPVPVQRSSTPVPVQRSSTPVPAQRTPTPPPAERRLTPPPVAPRTPTPPPTAKRAPTPPPIARAPTPPPVPGTPSESVTVPRMSAATPPVSSPPPRPVVPPVSITGRIPKVPAPALRGAGAVPRPPDSGPGRSGLGTGRSSGPLSSPPPPSTPAPVVPTPVQTRPRIAAQSEPVAKRADTTSADTVPGAPPVAVGEETVTRPAVPIKLTDTQPGTGPTTLPATRSATDVDPAPAPDHDDPFGGDGEDSDPDIFAGLFDESSGENALIASQLPRSERPTEGPPPADPRPEPTEAAATDSQADDDDLPAPAQEMEADEPPLLRTLVGHVPITGAIGGATNGARPSTSSGAGRISNIIPRKREQPPAPATTRAASETEPPDPGEITVPRRTASVRRVLPTAPPDDAFERDTEMHTPSEEASSSILQAAARAADIGVAQPVSQTEPPPLGPPPRPPGPESVEIEIVRPYLEPEYGADPHPLPGAATMPDVGYMNLPPPYPAPPPQRRSGGWRTALKMLLVFVLLGGMAAGGYFGYMAIVESGEEDAEPDRAATPDRTAPDKQTPPVASAARDAGPAVAAVTADAGAAAPPAAADAGAAVAASDLSINSVPPDAKVYLDGAPVGKTPLRLDATGDRHKLALILPGFKLHTAEIDGRGSVSVELQEVTPSSGPAGIKVRCKEKNRYYVIVDGSDTGQVCPTERIGSVMGPHSVEIYDPVTDSRRTFPIRIEQTRLSTRIRVD